MLISIRAWNKIKFEIFQLILLFMIIIKADILIYFFKGHFFSLCIQIYYITYIYIYIYIYIYVTIIYMYTYIHILIYRVSDETIAITHRKVDGTKLSETSLFYRSFVLHRYIICAMSSVLDSYCPYPFQFCKYNHLIIFKCLALVILQVIIYKLL